jgi:RNA polymerase sigma-70 factor (ECF subfamily)
MNEEARLLQMFCDRDERALAAAEQRYGKLSRSVAFRILGDERDAEECANDVLMKLWDSIPPAAPRSLTAFVSGITRNLALDRLSAKQAEKRGGAAKPEDLDTLAPYLASDENIEEKAEETALHDAVMQFLRTLPKEARMVFLARYYAMLPIREIAAQHGASQGKIKMILKRTKEKLKVYLKEEGLL